MRRPKPDFSVDEIIAELEALAIKQGDGVTAEEVTDRIGMSRQGVQNLINHLVKSGRWEYAGHRKGARIDGAACWRPVYRPKAKN